MFTACLNIFVNNRLSIIRYFLFSFSKFYSNWNLLWPQVPLQHKNLSGCLHPSDVLTQTFHVPKWLYFLKSHSGITFRGLYLKAPRKCSTYVFFLSLIIMSLKFFWSYRCLISLTWATFKSTCACHMLNWTVWIALRCSSKPERFYYISSRTKVWKRHSISIAITLKPLSVSSLFLAWKALKLKAITNRELFISVVPTNFHSQCFIPSCSFSKRSAAGKLDATILKNVLVCLLSACLAQLSFSVVFF